MDEPETPRSADEPDPYSPLSPANVRRSRMLIAAAAVVALLLATASVILRTSPDDELTEACQRLDRIEADTLEAARPDAERITQLLSSARGLARDAGDGQLSDALDRALRGLRADTSDDPSFQEGQRAALFDQGVVSARNRCAELGV